MDLVNPDQLVCVCGREAIDTPLGWIHPDGSELTDCGDSEPLELAQAS
jgi:hypothetical protein